MALDTHLSITAINAQAVATGALCNSGYLRLYSAPRPDLADDAASGTLLAELRFSAAAFGSPIAGVITANAITPEDAALANGDVAWFRALSSDGATAVFDGSAGASDANLILPTATLTIGLRVEIDSLTYTQPGQ